jgi:hypothetical protein
VFVLYLNISNLNIANQSPTKFNPRLKPRLNLLLRVLQRPLAPRLLGPHGIDLRLGEALRLRRRVISEPRLLRDIGVRQIRGGTAVGALVHGAHNGAAETEVVLQRDFGVLDGAVVGPAAQVPDELGALRQACCAERVAL